MPPMKGKFQLVGGFFKKITIFFILNFFVCEMGMISINHPSPFKYEK